MIRLFCLVTIYFLGYPFRVLGWFGAIVVTNFIIGYHEACRAVVGLCGSHGRDV